jgi:hypothetical protein
VLISQNLGAMNDLQPLAIQADTADRVLTPQEARFNALVRDVALWRAALTDWQEKIERYEQAVDPVRRQLHAAWRQWVLALDGASLQPGLARAERRQLSELLREAAAALLSGEDEDLEIAAVLSRHEGDAVRSPGGTEGNSQPDLASTLESTADGAGHSPSDEELFEHMAQKWQEQADAAAVQREEWAASRRAATVRKRRTKEAQEVSQSLRDVYRRLASALHPDRETDAQQHGRKTALMQQANRAYAEGDLLALLELQLQAEQVNTGPLAALDQRRLQHYITVLQGQLAELQSQTRRIEAGFCAAAGIGPGSGLPPRKFDRLISAETQRLQGELLLLGRQTKLLRDVEATKSWLRELRKA